MEVLSDILRSMRVAGSVYFCDRLLAPWSRSFDDPTRATFHLVRKGECFLRSAEVEAHLFAGDFVFICTGFGHFHRGDIHVISHFMSQFHLGDFFRNFDVSLSNHGPDKFL